MLSRRIGEPCPKCAVRLQRRKTRNRGDIVDIAYCAGCNAAFELAEEEKIETSLFGVVAVPV